MPRQSPTLFPKVRRHRAKNLAYVRLSGQQIYLGRWETAASRAAYDRAISEWLARGRRPIVTSDAEEGPLTVTELLAEFLHHAKTYYRKPGGQPTGEHLNFKMAMRPLKRLYGPTPAVEFSPLKLEAVRDWMVRQDWSRTFINRQIHRVRAIFKWGVSKELLPPAVHQGLLSLAALSEGRCNARESNPVGPAAMADIEAALPWLPRAMAAAVRLQLITGMRPGEVLAMRTCDIDRSEKLWIYRPRHWKTRHHGHERQIFLGPRAQELLVNLLRLSDPEAHLFDPRAAVRELLDRRAAARRTPHGLGNSPGTNRRRRPKRRAGSSYTVHSYRRAIARAADRADLWGKGGLVIGDDERVVKRWTPHQLRHTAATELRKTYGLEAAQVLLGHRTLTVTQIYAEKNTEAARRIAAETG